ncbi:transposase [Paraburkholderia sp. BR10954]|uniref:transposase n=1 Tax=Paraburkholderia sp. BR10954 TaxID=3236995 RepID=UPI0034D20D4D
MKAVPRRKHTEQFRAAAVEKVIVGRRGLREVARSLEMSDKTLANWVGDARKADAPVKRGQRPPVTDLEAENARLKQENARWLEYQWKGGPPRALSAWTRTQVRVLRASNRSHGTMCGLRTSSPVNARDAITGAGEIRINVSSARLSDNDLGTLRAGRYVKVSVTDTGSGMS